MGTASLRVIGMLGGMSWESSAEYYRLVNEVVRERLGGLHSARCVLVSVDFADIEELQASGRWEQAGKVLAAEAALVQAAGAEVLLLCTNTMHKVADQIEAAIDIPLLHIADVAAAAVSGAGVHIVGLLGTAFTMEQDFYVDRLAASGLDVLVPPPADRAEVHRIIYDELCLGIVRDESRQVYREVIDRSGGGRGGGNHPRLHRDRAADHRRGQPRPGVPDHAPARRGGGRPGVGTALSAGCRPIRLSAVRLVGCASAEFGGRHGRLPEWPKGADCKSAGIAYGGSNPSPATPKYPSSGPSVRSGPLLSVPGPLNG